MSCSCKCSIAFQPTGKLKGSPLAIAKAYLEKDAKQRGVRGLYGSLGTEMQNTGELWASTPWDPNNEKALRRGRRRALYLRSSGEEGKTVELFLAGVATNTDFISEMGDHFP